MHKNWDKLRPDGVLGLYADFTFWAVILGDLIHYVLCHDTSILPSGSAGKCLLCGYYFMLQVKYEN